MNQEIEIPVAPASTGFRLMRTRNDIMIEELSGICVRNSKIIFVFYHVVIFFFNVMDVFLRFPYELALVNYASLTTAIWFGFQIVLFSLTESPRWVWRARVLINLCCIIFVVAVMIYVKDPSGQFWLFISYVIYIVLCPLALFSPWHELIS